METGGIRASVLKEDKNIMKTEKLTRFFGGYKVLVMALNFVPWLALKIIKGNGE